MLDNVYNNPDIGNITVGVYLNLQKAFDTVDHGILLHKLHNYGNRGVVLNWFSHCLTNRQQFVAVGDNASILVL